MQFVTGGSGVKPYVRLAITDRGQLDSDQILAEAHARNVIVMCQAGGGNGGREIKAHIRVQFPREEIKVITLRTFERRVRKLNALPH